VTARPSEERPAIEGVSAQPASASAPAPDCCGIVDTPAEPFFDGVAETLAHACGVQTAVISFADGDRQWFKAKVGTAISEIPTHQSFCRFTLEQDTPFLEVPDAAADPRFSANPFVAGPPGVRFYAGHRIDLADGARVGTLCVIDTAPRHGLTPAQRNSLKTLARLIGSALDQRRTNLRLTETVADLERARAAEREAARERDLMRRVVEATTDGILVTDARNPRHQPIIYANPGFGRLIGCPVEELLGQTPRMMLGPQSDPAAIERVARAVDDREAVRVELICHRADGTPFWNDITLSPVFGEDGRPIHWIGINRDVTARHRMQETLKRRKDDLRLLFEGNPVPMWVFDVETLRFIEVNDAAKSHYGYGEGWRRMTVLDLHLPEDHEQVRALIHAREPEGLVEDGLWRHHIADGREIVVNLMSHRVDYAGRPAALVAAIDVTERLVAERAALEARTEAERANKAKSEFLAHMSHELRTPLNAIMGLTETMALELFGPIGVERYRDYAGDVLGAAQHLLNLINEVLDLSKIEAGQRELNPVPTSFQDLADSAQLLVSGRCRERAVTVTARIDPRLPPLEVDAQAMRQVLTNLLDNAIKFSPAGGVVELIAELCDGGACEIAVVDTGPGMTAKEAHDALQPFRQSAATSCREEHGIGLGLPIAARLVELHGGILALKSARGRGTQAIIRLPARRVADGLQQPVARADTGG